MPEISVIVPNYNHAKFLQKRLDSVFNQTYQNIEVILLDDASTDDSVKILKEYAGHTKVSHFIVNKENSGSPFKQWEKGISLAKGKYVWIAESDDWAENNFLEVLIPKFEQKTGIVFCSLNWVNEEGERIEDKNYHKKSFLKRGVDEIKEHLLIGNTIQNVSSVLFKRKVFDAIDLSKLSIYKACGDWILYVKILKNWDLVFENEPLCYFRRHKSSTSSEGWKNGQWTIEGSDVLNYFNISEQMSFFEYRIILQTWILKARKLPKQIKKRLLYKIISSSGRKSRLYFWLFYWRTLILDKIQ